MTPTEKAVINAARFLCRDFGRITVSHGELWLRLHRLHQVVAKLEQRSQKGKSGEQKSMTGRPWK